MYNNLLQEAMLYEGIIEKIIPQRFRDLYKNIYKKIVEMFTKKPDPKKANDLAGQAQQTLSNLADVNPKVKKIAGFLTGKFERLKDMFKNPKQNWKGIVILLATLVAIVYVLKKIFGKKKNEEEGVL